MSMTRNTKVKMISIDRGPKADEVVGCDWSIMTTDKGRRELAGRCVNVKRNDTGSTDFCLQQARFTHPMTVARAIAVARDRTICVCYNGTRCFEFES